MRHLTGPMVLLVPNYLHVTSLEFLQAYLRPRLCKKSARCDAVSMTGPALARGSGDKSVSYHRSVQPPMLSPHLPPSTSRLAAFQTPAVQGAPGIGGSGAANWKRGGRTPERRERKSIHSVEEFVINIPQGGRTVLADV